MLLVIFEGSLRIDAGIFTVGTLGSESFSRKARVRSAEFFCFYMLCFCSFICLGETEISEIEIFKKKKQK